MLIGEFCNREVVICNRDSTILEVAQLMRQHHVGDIVITEEQAGEQVPVGVLTDRDIVVKLLAEKVDLDTVKLADVMSSELLIAREDDDLLDGIKQMRSRGIRRLLVVNAHGGLVGIMTMDDMIELLSEQLNDLVELSGNQQAREGKRRVRKE